MVQRQLLLLQQSERLNLRCEYKTTPTEQFYSAPATVLLPGGVHLVGIVLDIRSTVAMA